ncbi:serine/threonine-protein kinase haspin homolog [Malania oleifera]|uniref:serine/threonine-protein kinase haspin homolog n=1 Tax=Malania oleifera TaxID=397392 RepID=UPI0025ADBF3F|nr:serine/threonine-protein kinase haspin homolog [Malania oleifera]
MASQAGASGGDLWSEIIAMEQEQDQQQQPQIAVIYRRRKPNKAHKDLVEPIKSNPNPCHGARMSLAPNKRVSWNRSLSTRGRTSIAIATCVDYQPQQRKPKRKAKPPLPKGKVVHLPNYERERAYFEEVDAFELLEESPSPKHFGTWAMGIQRDSVAIPPLSSVLEKWLISKKLNYSCGPSHSLSKILETSAISESKSSDGFDSTNVKTPEKASQQSHRGVHSVQNMFNSSFMSKNVFERCMFSEKSTAESLNAGDGGHEDLEVAVKKLSLASQSSSLYSDYEVPFSALLAICGQSAPSTLSDAFSDYCYSEGIVKVGEGTYGEAFMIGKTVCKIVPIDGDLRVNGEVQKRSEELLEEVMLSHTLNCLRGDEDQVYNACTSFIKTIDLRVCRGSYDAALIRAWEDWDENHGSENDHPKEFPEKQCFVVFVLEHGGQDLESFVLLNFNEARSLLVQVTAALAVAEAAYEFEHRDLHWGNILLSRKESETLQFTLEGRHLSITTFGLFISIIDFTLSRINTGEDILFLDLSADPELFEGPKGDKQSDTYRKMKEITEDYWEGSFPKTNVLWLQYLVDILLLKKSFRRTSKDERDLRSLKKRFSNYGSAKEAIFDPFFSDLFVDHTL